MRHTAPCYPQIPFPTTIYPPMAGQLCSSLFRLLDEGSPPPALISVLSKKWTPCAGDEEAPDTNIRLSHAAINLAVGARAKTGWVTHEILRTLAGRHAKGVDRLTFLAVYGDGLVSLLHSLFCVTGGKYEERPGNLWTVKG